jgi:CRISPR-associated protein Csm5
MASGKTYTISVTVLSPVHIGSGRNDLMPDIDFVRHADTIWVIDSERMFELLPVDVLGKQEIAARITDLLRSEQYAQCARYSLRDPTAGGWTYSIQEHIKDSFAQAYIPGSSLKGAIRTAMAWRRLDSGAVHVQVGDLRPDSRFADDGVMGKIFGDTPNLDVMRALHIADTEGVAAAGGLALEVAAVYSLRADRLQPKGADFRSCVEVLPIGTVLTGSLRRDDYLLQGSGAAHLGLSEDRRAWFFGLLQHCSAFAEEVIVREQKFYAQHGLAGVAAFYRSLADELQARDQRREFLLDLGWGTGWLTKTVGLALDPGDLAAIREQYHLGRSDHELFPKTRRLIERANVPELPLGWVKVRLEA